MIYVKPEMEVVYCEETDVIRTSLVPGQGGGPDIPVTVNF